MRLRWRIFRILERVVVLVRLVVIVFEFVVEVREICLGYEQGRNWELVTF